MAEHLTIREHQGALAIHVNEQPMSGLAFWHAPKPQGKDEWQLFARSGVSWFQVDLRLWPGGEGGPQPQAEWDQSLHLIQQAVPAAKFWIRLSVEPPSWWLSRYPEHGQIHFDQNQGDRFQWRVAYASELWLQQTCDYLQQFVSYMETHWGEAVWCYQLNAGDCGEWAYAWKTVVSGYAPVQIQAWRGWLQGRYQTRERLQQAWADEQATFEQAEPATREQRMRRQTWPPTALWYDSTKERRIIDWLHFHGYAQARALARLAQPVRHTLNQLQRKKLIAAFHGYHLWPYGAAYGPCNTGFSDLEPVLGSRDIDVLCTPLAYIHRQPGGLYSHHNPAASLALNHKMFFTEDDTFTHRAKWTPWRYCCKDAGDTLDILQRNLAGVLCEGGSQWWMDHDCAQWYCDPVLEAGVRQMRETADRALTFSRQNVTQVVMLTHEASFRLLRQDDALFEQLWTQQWSELLRIGAPVELVRLSDLKKAHETGATRRWKLVIVAGCLWMTDEQEQQLRDMLLRDGRTVLFVHGQGVSDGEHCGWERINRLTGARIREYPHGGACVAQTMLESQLIRWGTEKTIAPMLYADAEDVEVQGYLERQYLPAWIRKRHADWTMWWSSVPAVPWQCLAQLAREAGVHLYAGRGDQIMANRGMLAMHSIAAGEVSLKLPGKRQVIEAWTGTELGTMSQIDIQTRRGQTHCWHLGPAS